MTTQQLITKNAALAELGRIAIKSGQANAFHSVRTLINSIFDERTPSYRLEIGETFNVFMNSEASHYCSSDERQAYMNLMTAMLAILHSKGYRQDIYTRQEYALAGGTEDAKYDANPHVPIGLLDQKLTLEEIMTARQLSLIHPVLAQYYGLTGDFLSVSLEPLDDAGRTIRDPRIINPALLDEALTRFHIFDDVLDFCASPISRSSNFPFRRD